MCSDRLAPPVYGRELGQKAYELRSLFSFSYSVFESKFDFQTQFTNTKSLQNFTEKYKNLEKTSDRVWAYSLFSIFIQIFSSFPYYGKMCKDLCLKGIF
jgi:hypothetical protein